MTGKTVVDVFNMKKSEIINGCFFTPFYDIPTLKKLKNLSIREEDILIASYMRSGTHWAAELVDLVRHNGDTEAIKGHIHGRFHYLEISDKTWGGETNIIEEGGDGSCYEEVEKMPSPRLLVTHQQTTFMPEGVLQGKCKTVLMLRNPKSVIVSNTFMLNCFEAGHSELVTVQMMMNSQMREDGEKAECGTWLQQVESWLEVKDQLKDQLLIIYYEDMIKDLTSVVKSVATFLGKEFTDDVLAKIINHLQFKQMKANPATGDAFKTAVKTVGKQDASDAPHMRKGTIDDWKNHMTVAQSEAVDAYYKDKLEKLGLKFQYE